MLNLRRTLNQITNNNTPLKIKKYDNNTKLKIGIAQPYSILGLNSEDWTLMQSTALLHWNEDDSSIAAALNDIFTVSIKPRYYNVVKRLEQAVTIPAIVLSIISQNVDDYQLEMFNHTYKPLYLTEYFKQLQMLNQRIPYSLSAVSQYIINYNSDINDANVENGVNLILWDNGKTKINLKNNIYGLKHCWDHYDYGHIHQVDSFEHHRILLLNAIKRTWLAMISVKNGLKSVYTRVNYGYMAEKMLPTYTLKQYELLSKLNYGTVILPPYEYTRIQEMDLQEIEDIVLRTLRCLRTKPNLNTIYITAKQLQQERLLGNSPILSRITNANPIAVNNHDILYEQYNNIQLPIGQEFNINELLSKIEVNVTLGQFEYDVLMRAVNYRLNDVHYENPTIYNLLEPREYKNYLNMVAMSANRQYVTDNILKQVTSDGLMINVPTVQEQIMAYVALSKDVTGVNLNNLTNVPNAIITKTDKSYILDYSLSSGLLNELMNFKEFLSVNYSSMNISIVDPDRYPLNFMKICNQTNIPVEVLSINGELGMQIDGLFTFSLANSNMIFATIKEETYIRDQDSYELFISDTKSNTYYSLEFIDFSTTYLLNAVTSILNVLKTLTGLSTVKLQFKPLLLNQLQVGVRVVYSTADYPEIITSYTSISRNQLIPYTRNISTDRIVIDPVKSLHYPNKIIPRMGSQVVSRCDSENFNATLGYMSSICRYVTAKCYSSDHPYYEMDGVVDQSRIAVMDRLEMFRENTYIKPEQLIPLEFRPLQKQKQLKLTYFELVTQTDRMLIYLLRTASEITSNDLSDYGSAHFLNLCMTDNEYIMYDMDNINTADVPGVTLIKDLLEWGEELPHIGDNDALIYNSLFMNARAEDTDMSIPIKTMLDNVLSAKNIYFNVPYMNEQLYEIMLPLNLVELRGTRYYLKLSKYPSVPCLNDQELTNLLSMFSEQLYTIRRLQPTLLDYYFTSRMIQRYGNSQIYSNALILHQCVPLFEIVSKS